VNCEFACKFWFDILQALLEFSIEFQILNVRLIVEESLFQWIRWMNR